MSAYIADILFTLMSVAILIVGIWRICARIDRAEKNIVKRLRQTDEISSLKSELSDLQRVANKIGEYDD